MTHTNNPDAIECIEYKNHTIHIEYDTDAPSPRNNDCNIGYFIMQSTRHLSPDTDDTLQSMMRETWDQSDNATEHLKLMTSSLIENWYNILAIYPITKYEHSSIKYNIIRDTARYMKWFDICICGFYIVTDESIVNVGIDPTNKQALENCIQWELDEYNSWTNGEVYRHFIYWPDGNSLDSCGWYYDMEGAIDDARWVIDTEVNSEEYKDKQSTIVYRKIELANIAYEDPNKPHENRAIRLSWAYWKYTKTLRITDDEYKKIESILYHNQ